MEMERYERRRIWARKVAFVDLILLSLEMLSIVAFSIYVIIDTLQLPWKIQMRAMFKWGYAGIQITLTILGLWTVVQLIKATEPGKETKKAYKFIGLWEKYCYVCILVCLLSAFTGNFQFLTFLAACILVRIIFLSIVSLFMQEVKDKINKSPPYKVNQKL